MVFTKRLREGVRRGRIRCSVRIWMRLQVKVGGNVHDDIERRFQSAIAGCDSMQACMGISSLTTISSRQTGCGIAPEVLPLSSGLWSPSEIASFCSSPVRRPSVSPGYSG